LERIELLKRLQANWIYVPKLADPPRFHAQLVDTIRDRDPLAADAAMRAHVRKGLEKEIKAYELRIHTEAPAASRVNRLAGPPWDGLGDRGRNGALNSL
jgi:hypothetical protein